MLIYFDMSSFCCYGILQMGTGSLSAPIYWLGKRVWKAIAVALWGLSIFDSFLKQTHSQQDPYKSQADIYIFTEL